MIPTDPGFDPVQAAYNLTRKNPAVDWEIEMLDHLKTGDLAQAKRCGLKAASINMELAAAPEADAKAATEHLVKAALLFEQIKEYGQALSAYEQAQSRDPSPMTRVIEGRRATSPLVHFRLARLASQEGEGRKALEAAADKAHARLADAEKHGRWREALDDAHFLAEVEVELGALLDAQEMWAHAATVGAKAGRQVRAHADDKDGDRYELSRAAFDEALTCALLSGDNELAVRTFGEMAHSFAESALALKIADEKWAAFRPMEFLIEAGVLLTVAGDLNAAKHTLKAAEPLVNKFWSEQRGPTFCRMMAHLAIISGERTEAEGWRLKYRQEFERKERFDPEVVRPIQLEFDEEFYRMLGDEEAYKKTLIDVCRNLEAGMREIFEGVDKLLEEGLYKEARKPLDELGIESRDQRIWRLLSAFVDWKIKNPGPGAPGKEFEDHMWHAIHPFVVPRGGLTWSSVLDVLGAEEDPIDLYPLGRTLAVVKAARERRAAHT